MKGRKVLDVVRYGKVFYMVLDGEGRMPVLHLGMTGMVQASSMSYEVHERNLKRFSH